MTASTATLSIRSDGTTEVDASLRLTGSTYILCCTYDNRPPILSVRDAPVDVTITVPDADAVTADDLAAARRLADAMTRYVTELESHAARHAVDRASAA
jgi:hypothetical protein